MEEGEYLACLIYKIALAYAEDAHFGTLSEIIDEIWVPDVNCCINCFGLIPNCPQPRNQRMYNAQKYKTLDNLYEEMGHYSKGSIVRIPKAVLLPLCREVEKMQKTYKDVDAKLYRLLRQCKAL